MQASKQKHQTLIKTISARNKIMFSIMNKVISKLNPKNIYTYAKNSVDAIQQKNNIASNIKEADNITPKVEEEDSKEGVKPYSQDNLSTPLLIASSFGRIETVKALLKSGVNINEVNKYGEFPLYFAAQYGKTTTVKTLLENGADINL